MSALVLRPLALQDEQVARAAHAELAADGFEFLLELWDGEPWAQYVDRLHRLSRGVDLPADRVPASFLVAEVDGVVVGRSSVRYELNAWLAHAGGHIGYGIRPHARRRGWATQVLRRVPRPAARPPAGPGAAHL